MIYFTSDTHYFHRNIIQYSNRPYSSVEDMNESLIENHNRIVRPDDTVYFLGDFSFADEPKTKGILRRLNGFKHLVKGNHDKMISKSPNSFMASKTYNGGFWSIQDYKTLNYEGQFIVLFHYGCRVWDKCHRGSWLLYGHSHGSLPPHGKSVDVGVDSKCITEEYRPVSFDEVKEFMDKQKFEPVDHHGKMDD